ncbi:MAG TPA: iron-sulfur cluster repair di-iron protein [Bacteroidota bacterium]|nr:iron-sulfur cluster repair di-iron protein [Bacteroidota bacterium]
MSHPESTSLTLKEIVKNNFHAAAVFETYSLDFCCRGGKTVDEACAEKGLDPARVMDELVRALETAPQSGERFAEWDASFLLTYIVNNHHAYVRKMIPVLLTHTQKIARVHGENHPELVEIAEHFRHVADELTSHMHKEEAILFPAILSLIDAKKNGRAGLASAFGSVKNPIRMMESEHESAGDAFYAIRSLSSGYTVPPDGCTTYSITYQELQDFEQDLHQHVHLENNILFPLAIRIEEELTSVN